MLRFFFLREIHGPIRLCKLVVGEIGQVARCIVFVFKVSQVSISRLLFPQADVAIIELAFEVFAEECIRVRFSGLLVLWQSLCSALGWNDRRFPLLLKDSVPVNVSEEGVLLDLASSALL